MTKKYDDASWHYDGDFPSDLPVEAGFTHIGMFVVWAISANLVVGEEDITDLDELQRLVRNRSGTPGRLLEHEYDGKFFDDCLTEEGRAFAEAYYENAYVDDYCALLEGELPSPYHIEDSWETFDKLKPLLDQRFDEWKRGMLQPKQMS